MTAYTIYKAERELLEIDGYKKARTRDGGGGEKSFPAPKPKHYENAIMKTYRMVC